MVVIDGNGDGAGGNACAKNLGLDALVMCDVFHFGSDDAGFGGFHLG